MNQAVVAVTGVAEAAPGTSVQVRFKPIDGFAGSDTGWVSATGVANWHSDVTVAAGFYDLYAKEIDSLGNKLNDFPIRSQIGIGDVFIIAGQSNASSCGQTNMVANLGVFQRHYNILGTWISGTDPQRDADPNACAMGSFWPVFANTLMARTGFPVGLLDFAVQGTSVTQWMPSGGTYYPRIKTAIQSFPANGFRAFLWDQGENDAIDGMSQPTYTADMESIIDQSRADAGWTIPWGIAVTATYAHGSFSAGSAAIQAAQTAIANGYPACFPGANTDSDTTDRYDGTHFNATGQNIMSALWETGVVNFFGF